MTLFHFDNGLLFQDFPLRLRALDGDLAKLRVGASEVADFVQPANLVCPPVDVPVSELLENERDPGERLNQPTASYEIPNKLVSTITGMLIKATEFP